jgi:hypothetical protein
MSLHKFVASHCLGAPIGLSLNFSEQHVPACLTAFSGRTYLISGGKAMHLQRPVFSIMCLPARKPIGSTSTYVVNVTTL